MTFKGGVPTYRQQQLVNNRPPIREGARTRPRRNNNKLGPYFNPTYTRTGWIGQPPVLDRHEVVTDNGDVITLRQATP